MIIILRSLGLGVICYAALVTETPSLETGSGATFCKHEDQSSKKSWVFLTALERAKAVQRLDGTG